MASKREVYNHELMVQAVRNDLKEFNISEKLIDLVIRSYIDCKREVLQDGYCVDEKGIASVQANVRRVAKNFDNPGFTVKLVSDMYSSFKRSMNNKLTNDKDLQERLDFDPNE